jgi:hypothetical protein
MRASRIVELKASEEEPSIPKLAIKTISIDFAKAEEAEASGPIPKAPPKPPQNPLHMFGVLVPSSLRSAQRSAITMVSSVIPQLAGIDAEMKEMEIRIRRARKHHKRAMTQKPKNDTSALKAMATRDDPPPGVLLEGPAPPYVEVRFAEEWE